MAALGVDGRLSGRRLDDSPAGTVVHAGVRQGPAGGTRSAEPSVPLTLDRRSAGSGTARNPAASPAMAAATRRADPAWIFPFGLYILFGTKGRARAGV